MNRYIDYVSVDKSLIFRMLKDHELKVTDVSHKMNCSPTTVYGYLKKGRMPKKLANELMDAIFNGAPPFYYEADDKEPSAGISSEVSCPGYVQDLVMAELYLKRAIRKISNIERIKRGVNTDGD